MRKIILPVLAITAIAFTNCTPFKISTSEALASARELPVKGRNGILINQKLSFGEYRTAKVNRSWTEGNAINGGASRVLWITNTQKSQKIHFTLNDSSNNTSDVFCIAKLRAEDWTVGENPNSIVNIIGDIAGFGGRSDNTYGVAIYLSKEPAPWEMMIDLQRAEADSKHYIGMLAQNKNNYYTIHPITTVEKNGKKGALPIGAAGFEFRNKEGVALAAVSMIDNGKVYIANTNAKEKFILANAVSALLLHQTLE